MTKKELVQKLERLPHDWPLACIILESEDISRIASEINIDLTAKQIKSILNKLSNVTIETGINRSVIETIIFATSNKQGDNNGF